MKDLPCELGEKTYLINEFHLKTTLFIIPRRRAIASQRREITVLPFDTK